MSDSHDVGISIDSEDQRAGETGRAGQAGRGELTGTGANRIFIYDNYPGGIGFSQPLFRMHRELLDATRRLISECECENGCPGCVGPVGNTGPLAKAAALRILDLLLERALDPKALEARPA
jgi:ATP-dependent helicase YprA (DUF1998 family)